MHAIVIMAHIVIVVVVIVVFVVVEKLRRLLLQQIENGHARLEDAIVHLEGEEMGVGWGLGVG